MEINSYIFFGKSGSGKGIQSGLLIKFLEEKKDRKTLYVQTGQIFREFGKENNYTSQLTQGVLDNGGLLPAFMPIWAWTDFLIKNFNNQEDLIFDGVCRKSKEAPVLDSALGFYKIKNRYLIYINVSDKWTTEKLKARGRDDDTDKEIKHRLAWFQKDVIPSIEYFKNNPEYIFIEVNYEQTIAEVQKEILNKIF